MKLFRSVKPYAIIALVLVRPFLHRSAKTQHSSERRQHNRLNRGGVTR